MREYGLAAEALRKAIELAPAAAGELRRSLARDLMLAEQLDESLKVYQEIAKEDSRDAEAHLRMSQIYRQKRDFPNARAAANKARELEPNSLEIRFNEVNLLEAEGKAREAIDLMKEVVASTAKRNYSAAERGNRVVLLERLGAMYRANDQVAPAVETFRQMGEVDADMGGRGAVQIIETYRMAKDLPKADAEARAAMAKFPNDRMVRTVYASLLADSGKNDAAIAEMKKLVADHPDRETWMSLAQVYDKTKQYPEMANALEEAGKLSQSKEEKQSVQFMRGAMYEKQKQFDQAEAEFRKLIEADPNNAGALNYLGYMMADRGIRLQEALQLITKALELDPGNGAYLDSLGWVYYRLGRYDEAEEQLRSALEKVPRDPTVHDHLGDVYYKQGKLKEAISQWEVSLKEWHASAPAEQDSTEMAKVQHKLEGAKVQLAKQSPASQSAKP
jgi:tetratricopeptide (TPR) repeat protein